MSKQYTILLMDEDAEILEKLQTVLQREGYRVLAAVDGIAALRLARTVKPDLIVSDLLLAGLDGYEVWQTIRDDEEMPDIPIFVVTALAVPDKDELWRPALDSKWQVLAYDACLPKPIDLKRFVRMVKKLLEPEQSKNIPGGPSVVLAIDDNRLREDLADILCTHDFSVKKPTSLNNALQLVKTKTFSSSVLILDGRLADKRVESILLELKNSPYGLVTILVIDPHLESTPLLEANCNGFLTVPLHSACVITTVEAVLNLFNLNLRTQSLSNQLIATNRILLDTQQVYNAQNEELQHTNAQLRELDRLKQMFTGMVVHDLKSPLSAVLGALNFLVDDPEILSSELHSGLMVGALAAGNQMLRLVETLLEGQRLEDGKLKPNNKPFDITALLEICVKQISSLLALHNLELKTTISDNMPLVYADSHISRRILENLIDNAIKFSPRNGKISIAVTFDEQFVNISIEDTGHGIPKEQQKKIFDRFTQLENEYSTDRSGFGLGLTFCSLASQAMNGSIWVESDGQTGTTFFFALPKYRVQVAH